MNRFIGAVLVGSMVFSASSAFADPFAWRPLREQARMTEGIRTGAITPREAKKIERQETKLRREKRRAYRDGRLTVAERAKLERQRYKLSKRIFEAKHNRERF